MATQRRRVRCAEQLIDGLGDAILGIKYLRSRYYNILTPGSTEEDYRHSETEYMNLFCVQRLLWRIAFYIHILYDMYINKSNALQQFPEDIDNIRTRFENLMISFTECVKGFDYSYASIPTHPPSSPKEIVAAFNDNAAPLFSEDLAGGLADVLRLVLLKEGPLDLDVWRTYYLLYSTSS